ncbi:hypothetical protein GGD41_004323 [Paraburkholderia bryophila]|uniref:Uncharacterized protein n=1 Tax=Paraburkholderia bryophila TaxID=420952 RepID=A0A7Y9WA70_9BURK|nr:hypothetical protein [Paraburkholderia bryophila]
MHVDARQLAELAEFPLRRGDIHHREPLTRPRPDQAARDAKPHDRRAALQREHIAGFHVEPLLCGCGEEHRIGRERIEWALRRRHADQIRRDTASLEDIDTEQRQGGVLARHGDIERQHGTGERHAGLVGESRIDGLVEPGLCAAHLQIRLAGKAAGRRGEFVERRAIDQLHRVTQRHAECDRCNCNQCAAAMTAPFSAQ